MPAESRAIRAVLRAPAAAGLAAFALVAAAVRIGEYNEPLSGDATQFLYVGETIGHGGMPYADAAFSKGPLTALLFTIIDPIVGTSPAAVRLTAIPFAAVTALALAGYVAHYAGRRVGLLAGLMFAAFSGIYSLQAADVKTEQFGVAPLFGALWFATRSRAAGVLASGALVGCAVLINPAFAVGIPAVAVELWLGAPREARMRRLAMAAVAALAPVAAACVWLALGGALDDMLIQVGGQIQRATPGAVHLGSAGAGAAGPLGFASLHDLTPPIFRLWIVAVAAGALALRDARLRRPAIAMALVLAAFVVREKLATYELDYQWYPALPALCGAIALGAAALAPLRPPWRGVGLSIVAAFLAFDFATLVARPELNFLREEPLARSPYGAAVYPVAAFLRAHTAPNDRIIVAGGRAEVYWRAERRAPTRFFDSFGLNGDPSYPAERRRDLARHPPVAIVVMATEGIRYEPDLRPLVESGAYVRAYANAGSYVWLRRGA